jgi:hypothetical protein
MTPFEWAHSPSIDVGSDRNPQRSSTPAASGSPTAGSTAEVTDIRGVWPQDFRGQNLIPST